MVKADGLAAGKGVTVAMTVEEALAAIDDCFAGLHGAAGAAVVIEEFLDGEEASFFVLSDGTTALPLATAQDHKRVGDGDTGPNTGGMGAYSPAPAMTPALVDRTMAEIVEPTLAAMRARGAPFRGVLYAGLMLTAEGPKLIEYNVRFGDPETQVLMMRLDSDLLELLHATRTAGSPTSPPRWSDGRGADRGDGGAAAIRAPTTRASVIRGIDRADAMPGVKVFHAGTALRDGADRRQWRARAQRHGARRDHRRGAGARLRGGRRDRLAGRILPPRHRLAGGLSETALLRIPPVAASLVLC